VSRREDQLLEQTGEWHRGWRAVMAAFVGIGCGFSLYPYISSLFLSQFIAEFGWTRGAISYASIGIMIGAIAALVLGPMVDRFGARPVGIAGTLAYSGVLSAMAFQPGDINAYYGLYTLLVATGMATTGIVYIRPVAAWFETKRGMALAVAGTGVSVAAIIAPPVITAIISADGWRTAYFGFHPDGAGTRPHC
jgi:MFS transporter, OFA family, oxalate/formate antiporter